MLILKKFFEFIVENEDIR